MGLTLKYNLFYGVTDKQVLAAYSDFYSKRGQQLIQEGQDQYRFSLHRTDQDWTVLELDAGWEWDVRQQAQLAVSKTLCCPGFFIFVYDGDYWGYEFFSAGNVIDNFIQSEDACDGCMWFPDKDISGNPAAVVSHLPHLCQSDLASYLVQDPVWSKHEDVDYEYQWRWDQHNLLDIPVRESDEFTRFDQCAILDFLGFLGIRIKLHDDYIKLKSDISSYFWIEGQNTSGKHRRLYGRRR